MEKTQGNRYKLNRDRFHLSVRKTCFTVRTINHEYNLARDVVESSSLKIFKTRLDSILDDLMEAPVSRKG